MKNFEQQLESKSANADSMSNSERTINLKTRLQFAAVIMVVAVAGIVTSCKKEKKPTVQEQELSQLRTAVIPFTQKQNAIAAGYDVDVTGYRTQMGHHFLNGQLLDSIFEINKPEVMLYAPYGSDTMKLVAVEYAMPIDDLNNPPPVPEGFTGSADVWEINTEFHLWTLHVWIGLDNPHGIFASHNPLLP